MNMQNFLNWGSFYIAVVIYLYLRLAPTLFYAMLFSIGIMSFLIVELEYLERGGGPGVWSVALCLTPVGAIGLFFPSRRGHQVSCRAVWRLIAMGPISLGSKVFE